MEMAVIEAKVFLVTIRDEKKATGDHILSAAGYSVGIIHPMLTMRMVDSKWQSMILLKYLL